MLSTPNLPYILRGIAVFLASILTLSAHTHAAGLLKPTNSHLPDLQIREHHVDVQVHGAYMTTSVEQIFYNPSEETLEAIYSFPVPKHAAVGEFIYWINGHPVIGEVLEKQKAKEIYHSEKQAGRQAALVEKDEYRTFDISVTPVPPHDEVKIRLVYVQSAYVDTSIGRYVYPLADGGVDEQKNAFWHRNEAVEENFSFNFHLRSGYAVDALRLPKHGDANIERIGAEEWKVRLENRAHREEPTNANEDNEQEIGNINSPIEKSRPITLDQDIVVYWRLQEGLPGSVDLVTYKEPSHNQGTFMLTLTPGDDLAPIAHGRDWVFVLDVSGSMQGKYAVLAEGVRQALNKLPPNDRFRVIVFNNSASDLNGGLKPVSTSNIESALQSIQNYTPKGGTNLYAGLGLALDGINADSSTGVVLVTDGVANVGRTEKKDFLSLLKKHDVRLFTFIMGNSANRPLLEEMTQVSNGFALSVSNSDDIVGHIIQATSKLGHQALRNIRLDTSGVRTTDVIPETIGSLYRGEQLVVFGHYFGSGQLKLKLSGTVGAEKRDYSTTLHLPEHNVSDPEIERLWGYAKIQQLQGKMDYFGKDTDTEQAITDIATQYGLVTDYTSMLVVRDEVFDQLNIERKNQDRVKKEHRAREQRLSEPTVDQRADQSAPMFQDTRPSSGGSGGGAFNPFALLLLLSLLALEIKRRRGLKKCPTNSHR